MAEDGGQTWSQEVTPGIAKWLGGGGLLPQAAAVAAVVSGNAEWHFTGLALGYAYAALILSFLGGMWWGLAAQARAVVPEWVWVAAVTPSLVSLLSAVPWAIGDPWPGPSLALLGVSLLASLAVDYKLRSQQFCPSWWLRLRVPLSVALGALTLGLGYLA
jgi:hypothetical protein